MYLKYVNSRAFLALSTLLAVISILLVKVRADHGSEISNSWNQDQTAVSKEFSGPTSGKITSLDVICGKNHMTVRAEFSAPFYGFIFSKGTYGQDNCIYVKQNSGVTHTTFNVYYDQCGTKPDLQGKFYENTIVIQYGSDIIEAYDEAKRLRCEWFEAYEKPATFRPAIPVADLDVVEMNFQGDDIDCWMEIQEGKGPWSREVSKIVPVGQPMTIVVAINDYNGQFDMRVKSCVAHDGNQPTIALTDEYGCVLRPKMLTPFTKIKNPGQHTRATVISYSQFLAFKFPDSTTVQIQCTVEVCRHGCADACQRIPSSSATTLQPELNLKARWPAPEQQATPNAYSGRNGLNSQVTAIPSRIPLPSQSQPQHQSSYYDQPQSNHAVMVAHGDMIPSENQQDTTRYQPVRYNTATSSSQAPNYSQQQSQPPPPAPQLHNVYLPSSSHVHNESPLEENDIFSTNNKRSDEPQRGPPVAPISIESRADHQQPQTSPQKEATQSDSSSNDDNIGTSANNNESSSPKQEVSSSLESVGDNGEMLLAASNDRFDSQPADSLNKNSTINANNDSSSSSIKAVEIQVPFETSMKSSISVNQQSPSSSSSTNESKNNEAKALTVGNVDEKSKIINTSQQESIVNDKESSSLNNNKNGNNQADQNDSENSKLDDIAPGSLLPGMQPRDIEIMLNKNNNANGVKVVEQRRGSINGNRDDPNSVISANIEAMLAGGKNQFGARSQPAQHVQQQQSQIDNGQSVQPESSSMDNYQPASSSNSENIDEKINIDRSDDPSIDQPPQSSSSLSESNSNMVSSIANSNDNNKPLDDTSPAISLDELSSSDAKVKPVVGTEELASGPIQIEDRIGMSDLNEYANQKLNQEQPTSKQQPISSALSTNSPTSQPEKQRNNFAEETKVEPQQPQQPEQQQQQQQQQQAQDPVQPPARSIQRIDMPISPPQEQIAQHANVIPISNSQPHDQQDANQQQRMMTDQKAQFSATINHQQPYPNVQGQAKMMPDPSAVANRNMVAQTSSVSINLAKVPSTISPSIINQKSSFQQHASILATGSKPDQVMASNSQPTAQITNVPINIGFPNQLPAFQQLAQKFAAQQQQQQQQQRPQVIHPPKPQKSRFSLISPHAALQAVAARLLSHKSQQHQQHQPSQLPISFGINNAQDERAINEMKEKFRQQMFVQQQQPMIAQQSQYYLMNALPIAQNLVSNHHQQQQQLNTNNNRLNMKQGLVRSRRAASTSNEVGIKKTFMVVTGMDLAFAPNSTDSTPILDGKREEIVYGVCLPVVSLAFTVTCMFWLIVFTLGFSVYLIIRSRRMDERYMKTDANNKVQADNLIGLGASVTSEQFNVT